MVFNNMDAIQNLIKIDYPSVFISIFVILIGVKAIVSIFEWICKKLGLETKWMRQKREEHELLLKTAENVAELQEKHKEDNNACLKHDDEIRTDLKKLTKMFISKEIEDIRWEILDFTSALSDGRKYNKEAFNHIFKLYDKYEKILKENNMENGLVEESMKFIREIYNEKLKKES